MGKFSPVSILAQIKAKIECSDVPEATSVMRNVSALRQAYLRDRRKQMGYSLPKRTKVPPKNGNDAEMDDSVMSDDASKMEYSLMGEEGSGGLEESRIPRAFEILMKEGVPDHLRTTPSGGPFLRSVFYQCFAAAYVFADPKPAFFINADPYLGSASGSGSRLKSCLCLEVARKTKFLFLLQK